MGNLDCFYFLKDGGDEKQSFIFLYYRKMPPLPLLPPLDRNVRLFQGGGIYQCHYRLYQVPLPKNLLKRVTAQLS
jgi:hypothetical protein